MVLARLLPPEADPSAALVGILRTLTERVPSAHGAVIADRSGLPVARYSRDGTDLSMASAIAALITRAAMTAFEGLGRTEFDYATFQGSGLRILVFSIGDKASLILLTDDVSGTADAELHSHWAVMEIAAILGL